MTTEDERGPATAQALCRLEDIEEGQARGFTVETLPPGPGDRPLLEQPAPGGGYEVFVVRWGDAVHGYRNVCPHIGSPLNWMPDRFMSEDGRLIQCATHGAQFRPEDGLCVAGPCEGESLLAVEVWVEAGSVYCRRA